MTIFGDYHKQISEICEHWNKAEEDIKLAEQIALKVVNPAIKELRYAGRRIVEALLAASEGKSDDTIRSLFKDAEFNCLRARHDAIDAASSKIAADIDLVVNKLGYDPVLRAMPRFSYLHEPLNEIRRAIQKSRRERFKREELYSLIEESKFKDIIALYRSFQSCEPIMKKIAKRQRLHLMISYSVGVLGILLACYAFVVD